jgi:hypothetical protein
MKPLSDAAYRSVKTLLWLVVLLNFFYDHMQCVSACIHDNQRRPVAWVFFRCIHRFRCLFTLPDEIEVFYFKLLRVFCNSYRNTLFHIPHHLPATTFRLPLMNQHFEYKEANAFVKKVPMYLTMDEETLLGSVTVIAYVPVPGSVGLPYSIGKDNLFESLEPTPEKRRAVRQFQTV